MVELRGSALKKTKALKESAAKCCKITDIFTWTEMNKYPSPCQQPECCV